MKKITFYVLSILMLFSCRKDTANPYRIFQPGKMETGKVDSYRDGQKWIATAYGRGGKSDKTAFGIYFTTYDENEVLREYFTLNSIPYKIGKTKIETGRKISDIQGCWASYLIYDEDIRLTPTYFTASESYVEITKLDTVTNQIEGTFTKMTLEPEQENTNFPIKVVFGKGTFNTVIDFQ
jgi:hypothetical protein